MLKADCEGRTVMQTSGSWVSAVLNRFAHRKPQEDPMLNYFLTQIEVRLRLTYPHLPS
jgi:hypothetical protein